MDTGVGCQAKEARHVFDAVALVDVPEEVHVCAHAEDDDVDEELFEASVRVLSWVERHTYLEDTEDQLYDRKSSHLMLRLRLILCDWMVQMMRVLSKFGRDGLMEVVLVKMLNKKVV